MAAQPSNLKIDVEEPRTTARRLRITVPADRIERERESVAERVARGVQLPGFRKGKVPAHVLRQRFGATIERETVERIVDEAYREAVQEKGFEPVGEASVDNVDYSPGEDLTFDVEFEVQPEIGLDRVGGFKIEVEKPTVDEEEVDRVLERLRDEQAVWRPVEEGRPEPGDRVLVRMHPVTEDEAEEAEPREYQIVLGKDQAIPDVEEAIRTLGPGEAGEFTIQIPREGEPPESGETEAHRVRIHLDEVHRAELPELDDEFAQDLGDFEDLDELRARIRQDLESEAASESERAVRTQLIERIAEANPFDVPDAMVERYLDQLLQGQEGADAEQLAQARQSARPMAERAIKRMLIVDRLAEEHGLRATEDELDVRVEEIARANDRPVGQIWAQLQKSGRLRALEDEMTEAKVFEYLKSQSTIE